MLKRLFKKPGFLVSLALMPIAALLVSALSKAPAAPMTISVCCPEKTEWVFDALADAGSVISFVRAETPDESESAVLSGRADAAWIFPEDLAQKLADFACGKRSEPFIRIVESSSEISARISREQMLGALYPVLSEGVYMNFTQKNFPDGDPEKMLEVIKNSPALDSLLENETLESQRSEDDGEDYIIGVLRGLMALCVLLCALCGAVFTLRDDENQSFVRFTGFKRQLPALTTVFGAAFCACAVMFLCLLLSGTLRDDVGYEALCLALCALDTGSFALLAGALLKRHGRLAASIPPLLLTALALSPVFFNLKRISFLQRLFPIYWYLYSALSQRFIAGALIYALAAASAAIAVRSLKRRGS